MTALFYCLKLGLGQKEKERGHLIIWYKVYIKGYYDI